MSPESVGDIQLIALLLHVPGPVQRGEGVVQTRLRQTEMQHLGHLGGPLPRPRVAIDRGGKISLGEKNRLPGWSCAEADIEIQRELIVARNDVIGGRRRGFRDEARRQCQHEPARHWTTSMTASVFLTSPLRVACLF